MPEPGWEYQKALVAALKDALEEPTPKLADVYDFVPQGAAYPYVTIDSEFTTDEDSFSQRRDRRFVYLAVWSTYAGQKQVKQIMAAITDALHEQKLPLDVGRNMRTRVVRRVSRRDADGKTFQGQVTLEAITDH